jgi:TIR domain
MSQQAFIAIVVGARDDPRRGALETELLGRTSCLIESNEQLDIIDQNQVASMAGDARAVAVILCRKDMSGAEIAAILESRKRDIPIIPVVASLGDFNAVAPAEVADFNGFELADVADIGELSGLVLEALGLQRSKRKIFISYARKDSSKVAQQLRDAFMARWYSVFLDTISIRPGAVFQDELLQELADSDVVVLLNSPSIKSRPYVQKEIAFADQAGVGGVQVIWPGVQPIPEGGFFMPIPLEEQQAEIQDGSVNVLTQAGVTAILRTVSSVRTRLQQIREEQLLLPVRAYAMSRGWTMVSYLGRHIELRSGSDSICLNVALGIPTSFDLERAFVAGSARHAAGRLVYDPLGITNRQADHLHFLGSHLALQYLNPRSSLQWSVLP